MNFIDEMNAFERWLETNHLPASSQLLWYKLFMLNNRAGWVEWLQVDNLRLMSLIQVESKTTFIRAREKLIELNLIAFKKGKKGCPNRYKIHSYSVYGSKNGLQTIPQTIPQTQPEAKPQTAPLYKPNKTKQIEDAKASSLAGAVSAPAQQAVIALILNDKSSYPIYDTQISEWAQLYPSVDILKELRKMCGWLEGNPQKRKTKRGILGFVHRWLAKTQDMGGDSGAANWRSDQASGIPPGDTSGSRPTLGTVLD